MKRAWITALVAVVLLGGATAYAVSVRQPAAPATVQDGLTDGRLYFRAATGQLTSVRASDPTGEREALGLRCDRFAAAQASAICLIANAGPGLPTTTALILDRDLHETRRINLAGIPSRAQVSRTGRMISWTVFVTGDSYRASGFSTWTGILDTRTGYAVVNMENIHLYVDGERYHSPDVNYWGVTFAADDTTFYATASTRGRTYLVRGDYAKWEAHTVTTGVECPSLSPDGTRIVYKRRDDSAAGAPWRLAVLDLSTLRSTTLAEAQGVDDQAIWLDPATVAYARDGEVFAVPADGSGVPRRLVADGTSPVLFRAPE
ncbi:MAG: hypothetical protein HOU81_10490 [Hamadaea sp.]|uniref:hypothetical protein n=1 Tax=Hamadaea sp. TaxID=2024425 RepID=UPI0017A81C1F|nr:hypothetical protein [Hamadaea sp.]NUR71237.1 hypothetical protein [Hamadaea sp.]NUT19638.1 hypothetical protein [Hamadaea sp.]